MIRIISKFVQYPVKGCWANIFSFYQSVDHVIDGRHVSSDTGGTGLGKRLGAMLLSRIAPGLMAQVQAPDRIFDHIRYHFAGS